MSFLPLTFVIPADETRNRRGARFRSGAGIFSAAVDKQPEKSDNNKDMRRADAPAQNTTGSKAELNMKKICVLAAAAAFLITMTACGAGNVGGSSSGASSSQASSSAPAVSEQSVEDNLKGLETYLAGNGAVSGDPAAMRADVIGAKSGARYQFSYNGKNNVTVELYEFDPDAPGETAKRVLESIRADGGFTLMDQQIPAILSDSGKYVMIYKDTVTNDENKAHAEQVKKLFTEFKK